MINAMEGSHFNTPFTTVGTDEFDPSRLECQALASLGVPITFRDPPAYYRGKEPRDRQPAVYPVEG